MQKQCRFLRHSNTESAAHQADVKVLLDSFTGKTIRIKVAKKPEMVEQNLLADPKENKATNEEAGEDESLWSSISRYSFDQFSFFALWLLFIDGMISIVFSDFWNLTNSILVVLNHVFRMKEKQSSN